jgi:hypothetical protein
MRGLTAIALVAFAVFIIAHFSNSGPPPAKAPPAPPVATIETVPDGPNIPHAFTVLPRNFDHVPAQLLVDADEVILRWKKWKAKPTDQIVPFSDYRNARMNLTKIKVTDPEFEPAKTKAAELDAFGVELANAEIRLADKIRAKEKEKAALALLNDVDGRKRHAKTLEEKFLRNGMDARVTIEGEKSSTLRIKYIGFTRPTMFKLQEEGKVIPDIIEQARDRGFRKLIMWDGYDLSWTWDLAKS